MASFSVLPDPACTDNEVEFTAVDQGIGALYNWDYGDGGLGAGQQSTHSYRNSGSYTVALKVESNLGCLDSVENVDAVQVIDRPVALFNYSPNNPDIRDPKVQLNNQSSFADNYSWDFGDGSGSSDQNPLVEYADSGRYPVQLIAYNSIGCSDTSEVTIQIKDVFLLYVPNAFSPNGVQPNENFRVKGRGIIEYKILIFNRWGEILWSSSNLSDTWDGTRDGEVLDQGVYFFSIQGVDLEGNSFSESGEIILLR
jgi:gliding motility-associated-like protein